MTLKSIAEDLDRSSPAGTTALLAELKDEVSRRRFHTLVAQERPCRF